MAGKIQGADVKTEAELISAGATASSLIQDTQIYVSANTINKTLDDAIIDGDIGSGGGGINYIRYGNAAAGATTGWATYADAAGTSPVDGTGGSPTVTWTASNTSPLRGTHHYLLTKSAANLQGQGASYDFTIDSADQGRVLQIGFDYKIVSGTYASGDITVWIYDVTNAVLLPQPSGNSVINTSIASQQGQCTFQSSINSTSYRLIVHVSTTSASAYTLAFDNFSVGPQVNSSGAVDTDWISYTPTFTGFGTVTSIDFKYRRNGTDIEVVGTATSGTPTATEARLSLPSGIVGATLTANKGAGVYFNGATSTTHGGLVIIESAQTYFTFGHTGSFGSSSINPYAKANGDVVMSSGGVMAFNAKIQVAGWGPNTVLSTSANTRAVVFTGTQSSQAVTADVTNVTFTSTKDTVAGWATNIYTVAVPGDYLVSVSVFSSATATPQVYKNGTVFGSVTTIDNASRAGAGSLLLPNLVVGDTISVRSATSVTLTSGNISILLLQSPQQIAASERISFSATTSNTAATTSTPFIFSSKTNDSHATYNSATGVFTAPAPGFYHFSAGIVSTAASANISLYKNGTLFVVGTPFTSANLGLISIDMSLVSGDTIDIRPSANATGSNSATTNYFSGFRIGN